MLQNAAWRELPNAAANAAPGWPCPGHHACATQPDATIASEIGAAWARFVRAQVDVRLPWPPFAGRAAEITFRLVGGLEAVDPRRSELAQICHWSVGLVWESLERSMLRDRPYETPSGHRAIFQLPGGALTVLEERRRSPSQRQARRRSARVARGRRRPARTAYRPRRTAGRSRAS